MDVITGAYFSYLLCAFMWLIAGFPKERKGYFLPYMWKVLEEALYLKIWPKADIWLKCIETYHPDWANNKVIQFDFAGLGFLCLFYVFRVILLQDLVILYKQFPLYPL